MLSINFQKAALLVPSSGLCLVQSLVWKCFIGNAHTHVAQPNPGRSCQRDERPHFIKDFPPPCAVTISREMLIPVFRIHFQSLSLTRVGCFHLFVFMCVCAHAHSHKTSQASVIKSVELAVFPPGSTQWSFIWKVSRWAQVKTGWEGPFSGAPWHLLAPCQLVLFSILTYVFMF